MYVVVVDDVIMMTHEGHLRLSGMSHGSSKVSTAQPQELFPEPTANINGEYVMGMGESVPCRDV